jgi:ribosomal protein L16 Arg81 hydroxylase
MVIQRLLDDFPLSAFLDEYFLKRPFSLPGGAAEFVPLGSWPILESVLAQPEVDVLVVKEGRRWEGDRPPKYAEARELHATGHTVLVRHAERHHPALAELANEFHRDFNGAVDVHIYCTPEGHGGFGWHYDAEDVFILQTAGRKEYSLRKNTVNPWPLVETLPENMRYEREIMPLSRCLLATGDWLYIPNGYWHMARAREASISLAIGVLTASAIDVYRYLEARLLSSLLWRQRLPLPAGAEPAGEALLLQYREIFSQLGADLLRTFEDEGFVREFLARGTEQPERQT